MTSLLYRLYSINHQAADSSMAIFWNFSYRRLAINGFLTHIICWLFITVLGIIITHSDNYDCLGDVWVGCVRCGHLRYELSVERRISGEEERGRQTRSEPFHCDRLCHGWSGFRRRGARHSAAEIEVSEAIEP